MSDVSRRRFLAWTGVAAGVAGAGGTALGLADLLAAPQARADQPVLVLVTLYSGNDGLNTVVPAGDPGYHDGRPELAYRPEDVLDLGEGLGLNPGMPRLHRMWTARQLAIVRGTGYPKPDRSHFRSMAIWQTATPDAQVASGWLGRWLDATGDDPMRAISVESTVPPFLAGERIAASTIGPQGLPLPGGAAGAAYRALAGAAVEDSLLKGVAARSVGDMHTVAEAVNRALGTPASAPGVLAAQLGAIAALVRAGVPTQVYSASLGGFDTHADERGTQERLLAELDTALGGFADQLAGIGRRVVTVVYSEFGRRVRANASHGTDHGTAAPMFVLGNGVRAGFLGAQPSLTDLDDGDLKFTVDFRDVFASLLEEVVGADAGTALPGWRGRLPLLA